MPTRPLFAGGVGFSPGSVRYIPTLGLTPAGAATELTITCHGLPNSIHVQVEFEDEGWTGTAVSGFVEVYVNGAWHDGTALFQSYNVEELYEQTELHAVVFGLEPNTTYPIRVTFRRYDVSGANWPNTANGLVDSPFDVVEEQVHEVEGTTGVDQPTIAQPRTEIYVDSVNGNDTNGGGAHDDAYLTLEKVGDVVNNQPGYDIFYVGECDFSSERLENINGTANNWNRFRPYDENSKLIGYVTIDDDWELAERENEEQAQHIWKVSLPGKTVGRVQYYDEEHLQWRLLYGCRCYDGADQQLYGPSTPDPTRLALKTGAKRSGDISDIAYSTSTGRFTITSSGHGLSAGDWVALWGIKADPEALWTNVLERIHEVQDADSDTFEIFHDQYSAGEPADNGDFAGVYTGGGHWESQKIAGFYYKRSTGELFVRLPDFSEPQSGQIRAGYRPKLCSIGTNTNGPRYVFFDLQCGLAGAYDDDSTDGNMRYCSAVNIFGAVGIADAQHCIFTGVFEGSSIVGNAVSSGAKWTDCLFDNVRFENYGPYDYLIGRSKVGEIRAWETLDDVYHFEIAFRVYQHDTCAWPASIHFRYAERIAVRGMFSRGCTSQQSTGTENTVEDIRYCDFCGCDIAEGEEAFEPDQNLAISLAYYHNRIARVGNPLTVSPIVAGPVWFVANWIDEIRSTTIKQGDPGVIDDEINQDKANAFVIYANNSVLDGREEAQEGHGAVRWHGAHCGAVEVNNAYSLTLAQHRPVVWINDPYDAEFVIKPGRINYHENNYYYVRNLGRPQALAEDADLEHGTNGSGTTYLKTQARGDAYPGDVHIVNKADVGGKATVDVRYTFNVAVGEVVVPAKQVVWVGRASSTAPQSGDGRARSFIRNWDVEDEEEDGAWDVLYDEWNGHTPTRGIEKGHALLPAHTSSTGEVIVRFYGQRDDDTAWGFVTDFIAVNHGLLSWQSVYYADFDAMHTALQANTARFVDQNVSDEELIDDETGLVVSAYVEEGVYIRGITNIASLGDGQLGYDVLGYFTDFSYEPPE
ncbi:MAG: hypothetical protein DCC68_00675 [Planctomycetota bacterium]|nr:MAG: hypothetical protein DCC68_00675 [Planctomycetota bacterium]